MIGVQCTKSGVRMSTQRIISLNHLTMLIDELEGTDGVGLRAWVELDPSSSVVRLRLKSDVVIKNAPQGFDIDTVLSEALRAFVFVDTRTMGTVQKEHHGEDKNAVLVRVSNLSVPKDRDRIRVLAEGDSWFRYPEFLFTPKSIVTQLKRMPEFEIKDLSHWGDTLSSIFTRKQYLEVMGTFDPNIFILSGGGNDLQKNIRRYIHPYSPTRPLNQYLTQEGEAFLLDIRKMYQSIIQEVLHVKPSLRVLVYGYDYPRPTESSQYIGQYLTERYIPEAKMSDVINPVMDKLNIYIRQVADQFSQVTYLDCRNLTARYYFFDDMHPNTGGFAQVTQLFSNHMRGER